jgi:hypothetical protein
MGIARHPYGGQAYGYSFNNKKGPSEEATCKTRNSKKNTLFRTYISKKTSTTANTYSYSTKSAEEMSANVLDNILTPVHISRTGNIV